MKINHLFLGFLFLFLPAVFLSGQGNVAQGKVIAGKVVDRYGKPFKDALVCRTSIFDCAFTDTDGTFHLLVDPAISPVITVKYFGYNPVEIDHLDTISKPLVIVLEEDSTINRFTVPRKEAYPLKFGFIAFFQVDFIRADFDQFASVLGSYNTDLMNAATGTLGVEMAGTYKRYYAGFSWGYANDYDGNHDSLDIDLNTNQFGLHFGYSLVNSKRFLVVPKVAIKWNRYRLINSNADRKISVQQYVDERDLDIRFNQLTGFAGLNLSFKIYNYNLLRTTYWTCGIYGGYCFTLNDKPWVYSKRNRLTTDAEIKVDNVNLGIHFSFHLE